MLRSRLGVAVSFSLAAVLLASCSPAASGPDAAIEPSPAAAAPSVAVSGRPLSPIPGDARPGVTPEGSRPLSPAVSMVSSDGREVRVGAGAGASQVVVFLAHWCPFCQQEVPYLVEGVEAGAVPAGVELVVVLTASDPSRDNWPPVAWLEREGLVAREASSTSGSVHVVLDDGESTAGRAFGVVSYPSWVVLDSNGRVVSRFSGVVQAEYIPALLGMPARP